MAPQQGIWSHGSRYQGAACDCLCGQPRSRPRFGVLTGAKRRSTRHQRAR